MLNLRRTLFILLLVLAVFYNLERLDVGGVSIINLSSTVYVFALIAVLTTVLIPWWRRLPVVAAGALWPVVYVVTQIILRTRPLIGDYYTYLTLTEIASLVILQLAARDVANALHDFEEAVRNITLADSNQRVRPLQEASEDIKLELLRSRRHRLPLTVVVVEPRPETIQAQLHRTVEEVQRTMLSRYVLVSMATVIAKLIRRIDLVVDQHEQGRFVILCPDTPLERSDILVERLRARASDTLGVDVRCGVAVFPEDALTYDDLVERAVSRLRSAEPAVSDPNPEPTA